MPQVTVYVRKEDLSKWEALEKKSEFIHKALATGIKKTHPELPDATEKFAVKAAEKSKLIKPSFTSSPENDVVKQIFPDAKPITYKKTGNWGA